MIRLVFLLFFFCIYPSTTELYTSLHTLSLPDALPICDPAGVDDWRQGMRALAANTHVVTKISGVGFIDRRWTVEQIRPLDRTEEHTSELQSLMRNSYAVFCLNKKKNILKHTIRKQKSNYKQQTENQAPKRSRLF